MLQSPDGDSPYFVTIVNILHGDTLASFQSIHCLDYVLQTSIYLIKENGFILKKVRSRQYVEKTMTGTGYADDLEPLTNTPAQAKSQLHNLEQITV